MVSVYSLRSGNAEAIEVIIHGDEHTSKVVGQQISQIKLPPECSIAAVIRSNQILLQIDDLILQAEDHVILLVMNKRYIRHVEQLFQVRIAYFG